MPCWREALDALSSSGFARLTNYGEFLSLHPPAFEVEILENSAWSCAHGLGRWREDCSCRIGLQPGWVQAWRRPLREALDGLRDDLDAVYEERGGRSLLGPLGGAGRVRSDRPRSLAGARSRSSSAASSAPVGLLRANRSRMGGELLEMQRYAMLMYTSCGWFFDDPSGLETTPDPPLRRARGGALPGAAPCVDRGGLPEAAGGRAEQRPAPRETRGRSTRPTCARVRRRRAIPGDSRTPHPDRIGRPPRDLLNFRSRHGPSLRTRLPEVPARAGRGRAREPPVCSERWRTSTRRMEME